MKKIKWVTSLLLCFLVFNAFAQIKYFTRMPKEYYSNGISVRYYDGKLFGSFSHLQNFHQNDTLYFAKYKVANGVLDTFTVINPLPIVYIQKNFIRNGLFTTVGNNRFCIIDTAGSVLSSYQYTFNYPINFKLIAPSQEADKFYVAGELENDTTSPFLTTQALICKFDTAGNKLWEYRRVGAFANLVGGMVAMPDSGVVVSLACGAFAGNNLSYLLRLDKDGNKIWERQLPIQRGVGYGAILEDYDVENKEFLVRVPGTYAEPDSLGYNIVQKVNENMQLKWQWKVPSSTGNGSYQYNYIQKIIKDRWGYIAIASGKDLTGGSVDAVGLVKFDKQGKKIWTSSYTCFKDGSVPVCNQTYFETIDTLPDGGYVLAGRTFDSTGASIGCIMRVDSMGCLTDGKCEGKMYTGISTTNEELEGVRLYPNPTSNSVTVSLNSTETKELHYSITNLVGQIMQDGVIKEKETTFDIHNLSSGMYVVNVIGSTGDRWSGKVVKE